MLRTLLRIAALALLAEGSVTRRLLTSWLGPRTKGELAARSAAASELYLLRGGSTKTRKKKKAKKKVVVEEDEDEDEEEEAPEVVERPPPPPPRDFPTASVDASISDLGASSIELSDDALATLDLDEGDCVRVHGSRRQKSVARVSRLDQSTEGAAAVLSKNVADNAAFTGSAVTLHGVQLGEALSCSVAPLRETLPEPLKDALGSDDAAADDIAFDGCLAPYFGGKERPVSLNQIFTAPLDMDGETYDVQWKVVSIEGAYSGDEAIIGSTTTLICDSPYDDESLTMPTYADVGGCSHHIDVLREVLEMPLHSPELFRSLGVDPPRGVLLHGPPGCGKTTLLRAAAYESGAHVEQLNGGDVASKKSGEAEELLRAKFASAERNAPSVVMIDELEAIAQKRDKADSEQDKRVCAQLLTLMDGLRSNSGVVVLAATGAPNELDAAVRRFGRLDREVALEVPDEAARREILTVKTRHMALEDDVDLDDVARDCHGFVGADLAQLCTEAALLCVRGALRDAESNAPFTEGMLDDERQEASWAALAEQLDLDPDHLKVSKAHFTKAAKTCNPSSLRESVVEVPDVSWADVGGLENVKTELKETVEYPVQFAGEYEKFGMPPSKGVLFYGPPGCGKTLIAKAVANECGANFISVKGPELLTMWFGESEANVRSLFDKARAAAPCILFFDEMDSIAKARSGSSGGSEAGDRVMNQILAEIDAVGQKNVFVIGATNRPDILDPAVTRPGRLDQLIHIPLPDRDSRLSVFQASLRKAPLDPKVNLEKLADFTEGFSGADISEICQRAAKNAVKDAVRREQAGEAQLPFVSKEHFEEAVSRARKSIPQSEIDRYNSFDESMKTSAKSTATQVFSFAQKGWVSAADASTPPGDAPSSSSEEPSYP